MPTQAEIEAVWSAYNVERIPGHDMSNECRLAAVIHVLEGKAAESRKAVSDALTDAKLKLAQTKLGTPAEYSLCGGIETLEELMVDATADRATTATMVSARDRVIRTLAEEKQQALNRESMALDTVGEMKTILYIALDALRTFRDETTVEEVRNAAHAILSKPCFAEHIDASRNPCKRIHVSDAVGPGEHRGG